MKKEYPHFKGKEAIAHLLEAREKGLEATIEEHGKELSGPLFAGTDAAKETAVILTILAILFQGIGLPINYALISFAIFSFAYLLYKTGRSALLGWNRLERLHRVIEEERWEIEHHRHQEKEELIALYKDKGFSGKLLQEVIEVLMADDNRLLQVMLQEELGLKLESFEHPLKQAFGAFIGTISTLIIMGLSFLAFFPYSSIAGASLIIIISSTLSAKHQKNKVLLSNVWNLALAYLCFSITYFSTNLIKSFV